jgi:membrane protein YqaA with SNARE-associated domain
MTMPPATATPARNVPRWHWHRRLYDWMLSFAHSPYATWALAAFSFCEAIFFPIPPFVLQIPLTLERRARAWYYAGVTSAASVVGGLGGYLVGAAFQGVAIWLFGRPKLEALHEWTQNPWLLTGGAIAIHPYKLYTIAAGFLAVPVPSFVIASIVGRSLLFFGIAALLWFFGAPVRTLIDRYFNLLTIVFGVAVVGIVVAAKML